MPTLELGYNRAANFRTKKHRLAVTDTPKFSDVSLEVWLEAPSPSGSQRPNIFVHLLKRVIALFRSSEINRVPFSSHCCVFSFKMAPLEVFHPLKTQILPDISTPRLRAGQLT